MKQKNSFMSNPSKELKKVTWPNRNKLVILTTLILFLLIILTSLVTFVDIMSTKLFYLLKQNL